MVTRGLGPRPARIVVSGLTAVVVGAAGLATTVTSPATAADPCVTAFPESGLTDGQAVEGLTVSKGTDPESGAFTGTISGAPLQDGIAPGVDLILAELTSPAVDKNGIWAGMSGSPVYADPEHTQLIGAVSYSLNEGSTHLAGITPASAMLDLMPAPAATVAIPRKVADRLVADGVATRAQLANGMRPLPTPIGVSGLTSRRFDQLAGWLDSQGPVANATIGSTTSTADASDIVPGGNIAASLGWGFVSAAAVGTVTAVCGNDVVAFGHPFNYTGDSTYSLHPADAVAIVPGATFGGYKLANLGDRVGTISDDHLAGIHGTFDAGPTAYDVSSTATYQGRTVSGTTHVTVADLVTDAGLANAFAASDRAMDKYGKGTARASWTITGKRRSGAAFELTHSDVYTDTYDVSSAPLMDLAMQAYTLLENQSEAVTITGISTATTISDEAVSWRIGRTYWRKNGAWKRVTAKSPAVVRAGRTANIRVELYSRDAASRYVTVPVTASRKSAGRTGRLALQGGFSGGEDYYFYDSSEEFVDAYGDSMVGGSVPESIPAVLEQLRADQRNDTIASTFTVRGTATKKRSLALGQVVSGSVLVPVVVRP
ncbi:hypothetical protein EKO23_03540 [Nocardioides guangzhouensis]|uniref:Peptidase S55 domain-containing protein n=1 Tax=Nocardioides guangzhouensis TaxID=2497878 RepID=A0A4V1XZY9_9ACTN|nr:hypothetical protein [Nocardioides guangzhouensis]RYP88409.1 hypothetical protein EKO23_03540 [Nocardioides guangzhouensis]